MKFLITIILIFLTLFAQTQIKHEAKLKKINFKQIAQREIKTLNDSLKLSEPQEKKVRTICLSFAEKLEALEDSSHKYEVRYKRISQLNADKISLLRSALSNSQFQHYFDLLNHMNARAKLIQSIKPH